ncbi:HoxN/HupN/NixA family nickel/cobalt transporter [Catellatospora vulcania]|uniref:HoxN/HupN/NixA family nickel/cobalt transporter n=1 Tax=Catellatospora vulcania TaxID=1460450 RepID=UPI0012D3B596|nr:cobalt transporter [Catellatospora vulcania]
MSAAASTASIADQLQNVIHSPGVPPLAFGLAFVAGAAHAVAPGHGKSLAAAYLIGSRGRLRDAAWLGGSVAVMHTVSVLVIGLAWTFLSLSDLLRMEELTGWLQLLAGLLVLATGLGLVRRHVRGNGGSHGHSHSHGPSHDPSHSHGHTHSHGHAHGHRHTHGHRRAYGLDHAHETDSAPAHDIDAAHTRGHGKRPGLVLLGVSGGLTPSPAAFLVLVTGLFIGRPGFALLLVMTFGIGMAVVLSGVGVLAIAGGSLVVRGARSSAALHLATRVAPVLAAAGITLFGAGVTAVAAVQLTNVT